MAKSSVYEGKSYDEAVKKGLDDLGLTRAEATITMIEEGKGGFLGLGARPYRVSIMRRPGGAVREPEERGERRVQGTRGRDDRRGGRGGRDRDRGPREAAPAAEAPARGGRDRDRDRKREGERGPQPQGAPPPQQPAARAEGQRPEGQRADSPRGEGQRREGRREGRRDRNRDDRPREDRPRDDRPRDDRPREERGPRPVAAEAAPMAPADDMDEMMPVAGGVPVAGGDTEIGPDGQRRRRRRGRRGGRGRRRGGPEGSPGHDEQHEPVGGIAVAEPEYEHESDADADFVAHQETPPMSVPPVSLPPVPPAPEAPAVASESYAGNEAPPAPPVASAPREFDRPRDRDRGRDRGRDRDRDRDRDHDRDRDRSRDNEPGMSAAELGETAKSITENLLKAMGFEATVTVVAEADRADVTVEVSQDDDLLNGQKGETRQAMQHLLNRFLNRGEGSRYHLQLEINDFWKRREDELAALARSLADGALANNSEMVTEYLNSQERRIVHVTLREDTRVKTYALGTGMIKRVAVAPADFPERTGEEDAG